jgi:serine/threonine-protein kinase
MGQGARWEHVRELGEGGMGRVSLARRTLLDGVTQRVVVKRAHGGDEAASRLRAEARALACIDHGNVVKLLDAGEDAEGPFLVLEHVDGVDAHALLEDARADAAMDPQEVAWLLFEACRGVAAAHGARSADGDVLALVHRDLSPQNLLASVRGDVKVADFGIAWSQARANRTTTGVVVGNPRFISPEQLEGRHAGPATDVFGLGRVLEELLAVTAPSSLRAALADLASLATRRLPEDRPADADRLADALLDAVPSLPRGRTLLAARVARITATRERIHHALRGLLDDDPPLPRAPTEVAARAKTEAAPVREVHAQTPAVVPSHRRGAPRWVIPVAVLLTVAVFAVRFRRGPSAQPRPRTTPAVPVVAALPVAAEVAPSPPAAPTPPAVVAAALALRPTRRAPSRGARATVSAPDAGPAATLRVNAMPWAMVTVDDGAAQRTPHDFALAPGSHTVRAQYNTGGDETLRVDLRSGEVRPLALRRGW